MEKVKKVNQRRVKKDFLKKIFKINKYWVKKSKKIFKNKQIQMKKMERNISNLGWIMYFSVLRKWNCSEPRTSLREELRLSRLEHRYKGFVEIKRLVDIQPRVNVSSSW